MAQRTGLLSTLVSDEQPDVVLLVSNDGVVQWASGAIERYVEAPAEGVAGTTAQRWVHPDDLPAVLRAQDDTRTGRESWVSVRLGRPGRWTWMSALALPMFDRDQRVTSHLVLLRDAGEDVAAAQQLGMSLHDYIDLVENSIDVQYRVSPDGVIQWVSPSVQRVLGWTPAQLIGTGSWELMHPDDLDAAITRRDTAIGDGDSAYGRSRFLCADGTYRWMDNAARPVHDVDGRLLGGAVSLRDVHEVTVALLALEASQTKLQAVVESSPTGILVIDADGAVVDCNPAAQAVLHLERDQILEQEPLPEGWVMLDEHGERLEADSFPSLAARRDGEKVRDLAVTVVRPDGERFDVSVNAEPLRVGEHEVRGAVVTLTDVTEVVRARRDLARSERDYRILAESTSDLVLRIGMDGVIQWASPASRAVLGRAPEDLVGLRNTELIDPGDYDDYMAEVERARKTGGPYNGTLRITRPDGRHTWVHATGAQAAVAPDEAPYRVTRLRVVDEEVRERQRLRREASHDPLTGLLNRGAGLGRLAHLLHDPELTGFTLAFCDLDLFKDVNDEHGHTTGDAVLEEVARRLRASLRDSDLVIRFGGDEVLVALVGTVDLDDAARVIDQLRSDVGAPIQLDGTTLHLSLSVGVTQPREGDDITSLLDRADRALYRAKHQGRDRVVVA